MFPFLTSQLTKISEMIMVIYGLIILLFEKSIAFHVNSSISHPNGIEEESYGGNARGSVNTSSLNLGVIEKLKGKSRAILSSKSWGVQSIAEKKITTGKSKNHYRKNDIYKSLPSLHKNVIFTKGKLPRELK